MRREHLEHVLRAAAQIAEERDVLVIGSQSILGAIPEEQLPAAATASIEVDVAFFDDPGDRMPFATALIDTGLIDPVVLAERIESVAVQPAVRQRLRNWIGYRQR